jgi:hypothetical protein
MPPLDWSIVKSAFLFLILPGFGIAVSLLAITAAVTRSENHRAVAATIAFVAAFLVGNGLNGLVPFAEFESGWRSLVWAMTFAALAELLIGIFFRGAASLRSTLIVSVMLIIPIVWVTPWGLIGTKPWIPALMFLAAILNQISLRRLVDRLDGHFVPLIVAIVWGGSATAVMVLSHSARFADLSILLSCSLAGLGVVAALVQQKLRWIFAGPAVFIPGLMLSAALNTYSDIPLASFILVAISPAILVFLRWKKLADWFETHPKSLVFVSLIPGFIAVGLAARAEM